MKGRDLARVRQDQAQRRVQPGDTAEARARRGRALVDAALRGEPVPEPAMRKVEVVMGASADDGECPTNGCPIGWCGGADPCNRRYDSDGDAIDPAAVDPRPRPPVARAEVTACARCYRPHEAPPDSVCASCADPPPQDLSGL